MKKLLLIILLLIACSATQINYVEINQNKIQVEVALTQTQQMKGLMFRTNLTGGMVFLYNDESERHFWMKNTLIPLDMIFIDSNNKIVIIHYALPCKEDPCKVYPGNAKYVLEVNGNFTKNNNIKVGDSVSFLKQQ